MKTYSIIKHEYGYDVLSDDKVIKSHLTIESALSHQYYLARKYRNQSKKKLHVYIPYSIPVNQIPLVYKIK